MKEGRRVDLLLLAAGLIGLGVLAMVYGDFALEWQPVPPSIPGRTALAYGSGILMIFVGAGLVFVVTRSASIRILFPYLFLWLMLKVPALFVAPGIEGVWLGFAEIAVLFAAGWVLFARALEEDKHLKLPYITGAKGLRIATRLFGLSLIPIGLSHLMYSKETVALIPPWIPLRLFWAYLTGIGQMLCGLAVLSGIYAGIAAVCEATMVTLFTAVVWGTAIMAAPTARLPWTAFFISWTFAASAWVVASSMRRSVYPSHDPQHTRDAAD